MLRLDLPIRKALCMVAISAFLHAAADGATITVSKNGAINTIQAGINAAAAGDTVLVKAGTYAEYDITTGNARAGLVVKAAGKVIVDASTPSGVASTKGFLIGSDNVKLIGLTIEHAKDTNPYIGAGGTGVDLLANGITIDHCTFIGCEYAGVFGLVNSTAIKHTTFVECGHAVQITGNGLLMLSCKVDGGFGNQVEFTGDNALLLRNTLVNGSGLWDFMNNQWTGSAIAITGNSSNLEKNVVDNAMTGIAVVGSPTLLLNNRVSHSFGYAIKVDGATYLISKNRVDTTINGEGIYVRNGVNSTIANNVVTNTGSDGIYESSSNSGTTLTKNKVSKGNLWCWGINSAGASVTIDGCQATSYRTGISVYGANSTIKNCVVKNNYVDGIFSNGDSSQILNNKSSGNGGEGIENNGASVTMDGNVSLKNHLDIANSGSLTSFGGNTFQTGGSTTPGESN